MSGRRRKALGRGLDELFPGVGSDDGTEKGSVPVELIDPNPFQPRREWDPVEISALAASVREQGIVQPLVLRRSGDRFQLIAGERRLRAAREVGLREVPAVVRDADDEQMLAMALVENLQRRDLGPMEKAEAFHSLRERFGLSQEAIASRMGMSRSAVANFIRLLDLPEKVQHLLREGRLQMGHGRALLAMEDGERMERLALRAARRGLSVRKVEELVRSETSGPVRRPRTGTGESTAEVKSLEERLQRHLGTRVRVVSRSGSGRIEISFHDLRELDRILEIIGGSGRGS